MKPNPHNPYGYKVCYRERCTKTVVRYFIARTYREALDIKGYYIRFPPPERETNRSLDRPVWLIFPITYKEVIRGIWRECPF